MLTQGFVVLKPWRLYYVGFKRKHGTNIGIMIISPKRILTKFKFKFKASCFNNEVEYKALILDLMILLDLGAKGIAKILTL